MERIDQIVGAQMVVDRFGVWPTLHDAEVVRMAFERQPELALVLGVTPCDADGRPASNA